MSIVLALPDTDLDMEMIALIKEALSTKRQNIVKTKHVLSALNQDTTPYNALKDETKIINSE